MYITRMFQKIFFSFCEIGGVFSHSSIHENCVKARIAKKLKKKNTIIVYQGEKKYEIGHGFFFSFLRVGKILLNIIFFFLTIIIIISLESLKFGKSNNFILQNNTKRSDYTYA